MNTWPKNVIEAIAATDDLHIAVHHPDRTSTGTLTWIWSVVVDGHLYVRAWNGTSGRWYRSALDQKTGSKTAVGK
ncbi:MAG: DUF2255 family protein, partial [Ancrocorticia sp.]|nr:DUF2255 family protein [Ancrocorticia sp.]